MKVVIQTLRVVVAVAQVLFLIGAALAMTGCSGGPTTPSSSQSSSAVSMAGPSVPSGTQSFWVDVRPNPIMMSVGQEASIQIEGSFDWYDLVVRLEPADAFKVVRFQGNDLTIKLLRRTTGQMTVEAYGSDNKLAKAIATINVQ